MKTDIWAHRGSSHTFIENTLAAFNQAVKDGADGIELDVQRTKDNIIVVIHDEHLERLAGVDAYLWELTWAEVQELTLSSPNINIDTPTEFNAKIPKLDDVLYLLKDTDTKINIELKNSLYPYDGIETLLVEDVTIAGMQDRVLYSSFNHDSMSYMADLVGPAFCGILSSDIHFEPWNYLEAVGVKSYHPMINTLQFPGHLEKCQEKDYNIHVWTADKEAHIQASLAAKVDAIITNEPKKAIQLREQFDYDEENYISESLTNHRL